MPFSQIFRVSPGRRAPVNPLFDAMSAGIPPREPGDRPHAGALFRLVLTDWPTATLPRPLVSRPGMFVVWLLACQSNRLARGGARHGGNREASAAAPFVSRWVRILSITTGSSMQAMILTGPPQAGQVWISMPNTRFRRSAQVIKARRSPGGGSSATPFEKHEPPLPRLAGVTRAR